VQRRPSDASKLIFLGRVRVCSSSMCPPNAAMVGAPAVIWGAPSCEGVGPGLTGLAAPAMAGMGTSVSRIPARLGETLESFITLSLQDDPQRQTPDHLVWLLLDFGLTWLKKCGRTFVVTNM